MNPKGYFMKFLVFLFLSTSLFAGSAFNLEVNAEGSYYAQNTKDIVDSPVCYAIKNQKEIEMLIDTKEKLSKREIRITSKKIVIDPYVLGMTKEGKIAIRGAIASEKLIKEVTVKFGEDRFDDNSWGPRGEGFLSGKMNDNVVVDKIVNIYVLQDSHFDVPRNYKSQKDKMAQVICEVGSTP